MATLRLGTRRSALAREQAERAAGALRAKGVEVEIVTLSSHGDDHSIDLAAAGSAGVFVTALRAALLDGAVDALVHSLKDLPTRPDDRFALCAVPERADARDVFVGASGMSLDDLPAGGIVGTSSPRRACWVRRRRPDLTVAPIRGNVETRLAKVRRGDYAATILAAAGLERLGLLSDEMHPIAVSELIPAPGQAAIAVECLSEDSDRVDQVRAIDRAELHRLVAAERAVLRELGADCASAAAAHASLEGDAIALHADVVSVTSLDRLEARGAGSAASLAEAESLGTWVATSLIDQGALHLIARTSS